jgi:hypothetical protein
MPGLIPTRCRPAQRQLHALPPDLFEPTVRALSDATTTVFLYAVPVLLVGFALAFFLPALPLRESINVGAAVEGAELADGDVAADPAIVLAAAEVARSSGRPAAEARRTR